MDILQPCAQRTHKHPQMYIPLLCIPQMFISNTNMDITKCTFPNPAAEGSTETLQLTYIPQLLAENIQYQYIFRNIHICI